MKPQSDHANENRNSQKTPMKTSILALFIFAFVLNCSEAQMPTTQSQVTVPAATPYTIVSQDANSRVWQREEYEAGPNGEIVTNTHSYTELATGLNHLVNGQFVASSEQIEILPDGSAEATQGQNQVFFPADILTGNIRSVGPDGVQLVSQPSALVEYDGTNTAFIAVLTNSIGQVVGNNQLLYTNAFEGIRCDILYSYTKAGFSQDIVLRQRVPDPASLGLNPASTRLQILTEFINTDQPTLAGSSISDQAGVTLTDEELSFGVMHMVQGKAFVLPSGTPTAIVNKSWMIAGSRQFLVEEVPFKAIAPQLQALSASIAKPGHALWASKGSHELVPPPRHSVKMAKARLTLAKVNPLKQSGVILDYQTINTSQTNYDFRGDTTYYISGNVSIFGTNVFEGGTVIKYASGTSLTFGTTHTIINWAASAFRPVILTAKDDNTVGENIIGSTGSPTNYYANPALSMNNNAPNISYFRIAHAQLAIYAVGTTNSIKNGQIINCQNGMDAFVVTTVNLENMLFNNVQTDLYNLTYDNNIEVQNSTFNSSSNLTSATGSYQQVIPCFTNCIFANISQLTNNPAGSGLNYGVAGAYNGFYNSPSFGPPSLQFYAYSSPFQTNGGGSFYLATNSGFHNVGTTSIDPTLLASLKQKTTYPPIVYSNVTIITNLTLSPQASRDTNTSEGADLGYHYDPLDYVMDKVVVTNATLTITNGAALATYNEPGIQLENGGSIVSIGTPTAPNWLVRYQNVQEESVALGTTNVSSGITISATNGTGSGTFQFTRFSILANGGYQFYDDGNSVFNHLVVQNSELYGGTNDFSGGTSSSVALLNNLFQRSSIYASNTSASASLAVSNNLFWGTTVTLSQPSGGTWQAFNNDFDSTTITSSTLTNGYNAYLHCSGYLSPTNSTDIFSTNAMAYQSNWLGTFYQPATSPLIGKGSTNANLLGLYHFTTQTNQVVEGTNIVTIGYHYVATDTSGNPLSTPDDGIPDYIADANGNGIDDPGETPWDIAIFSQPQSTNVAQGQSATFSVVPSGIGPFTYQWLQNSNAISQANGANYTNLVAQPSQDGYTYSVIVSNADGWVSSSNAILHVTTPFSITGGPFGTNVVQGATANFSVTTTGNYLVYRWYTNNVPLSNGGRIGGATTNSLTLSGVLPSDAAGYYVVVTNLFGAITSSPAILTVITNPWISSSSMTTNAIQSQDAPFSVTVSNAQYYQWWFSNSIVNTNIPGASGPNYTNYTQLVVQTNNAGFYSVIITNLAGSTNVGANLTVLVPPWINSQPTNLTVNQGSTAAFSVTATGTTNLYYQWFSNGTNAISGATGSSLTLNNVQATNAAGYSCLVSNIAGTNMSAWAWLSVISTGGSTNYGWGTNGNTAFILPVVSMLSPINSSPTNAAVYPYGTPISIRAYAHSQYSYITNVAFYFTGTNSGPGTNFMLAGTAVPGPNGQFALAWTNMLPGTNILEARAWDYNGNTTNSGLVYVIMSMPPSISVGPNTNIVWTEGSSGTNIQLTGGIINDGQPYSYVTNIQWSVVNGNGQYVSIANSNSLTTQVTFSTNGVFQMQLQVGNGYASTNKSCTIKIIRHPQITFISPINGSNYLTGSPLVLKVTAVPYDGLITNVTYYTNTGVLGAGVQSLNNTWVCDWQIPPLWANTVTAVAADDDGLSSTASVSVAVLPILAVQILSPTNQTFIAQTNVTMTAQALYAMGSEAVDWVEFFDGTNSLGYAYSSNNLFQINWIPLISGTNVFTALALNTNGNSALSAPVTNYVRSLPTIELTSPANGQVFTVPGTNITISASAAAYGTTTVSQVIFYEGTNSLYTNTTGAPYNFSWANVTNGIYTLYAQAIDSLGESGYSTNVMIAVLVTNQPPSVYAGPDQVINLALTNVANLDGYVSDDGLPYGSTLAVTWTNVSGPAKVYFANSNQAATSVTFTNTGNYVFQLSANDSQFTNTSDLSVTVISNRPPMVYAGPNETITNQDSLQLQGCATDDGLPYGTLVVSWSVISSPNQVFFANPYLTNTIVMFTSGVDAGVYHFRLTASDGQITSTSDVFITNVNSGSISYQASGWHYLLVTNADLITNTSLANFYMTNYDDSAFSIGQAAFGNESTYDSCPLSNSNYVNSIWLGTGPGPDLLDPYILLRNHFNVPTNTSNLSMGFTVDNSCAVYLNGVAITPNNVTQIIYENFYDPGGEGYTNEIATDVNIAGFWHTDCCTYEDLVLNGIATNSWHSGSNLLAVVAYDGGGVSYFDVRISYGPIETTNHAPVVSLGTNQIVETNVVIQLTGEVLDDGLPNNGLHTAAWSAVSGPGTVTFAQTNYPFITEANVSNTASFSAPGLYVLQCVANDSQLSTTGQIAVLVWAQLVTETYPTATLTEPQNGGPYTLGSTIQIAAVASPTGAIAKVDFYASLNQTNNILVGESLASPYAVNWVPDVGGTYYLSAIAIETNGLSYETTTLDNNGYYTSGWSVQIWPVQPPSPQDDTYYVLANSTNNVLNALANDTDPNNYPLSIFALTSLGVTNSSITTYNGGTAKIINNGLAISYSPPQGDYGGDGFTYWVSNGLGSMAKAGIFINIEGAALPLVTLAAANSTTNAGAMDPLTATVTNNQNIASVSFYQGSTLLDIETKGSNGMFTYNWQALENSCGGCGFTAQATDIFGQINTSPEIDINVTTSGISGSLTAELLGIIDSQGTNSFSTNNLVTVRDGMFQLYGEAYHSLGSNVVWRLDVYSVDGTFLRRLASGSNSVTSASNPMCTNDLTTLMNGVYTLQLTVTGGYQTTETSVTFRLESNLKVGEFSFSQQDLVIPVNNIPLTVTRTYNSINPNKGDFGYGWTYALNSMSVSLDETRQQVTEVGQDPYSDDTFSERSGGSWDVTLTLPNGQITTFYFSPVPANEDGQYLPQWTAAPGVTATLTTQDNAVLTDFAGWYYLAVPTWTSGTSESQDVPVDNFDFANFVLQTEDGTKYLINREDLGEHDVISEGQSCHVHAYGQPYLSQIIERNHDAISINANSIVFQATNGASRKITFQRNADGLITSVSDPNAQTNNGPPTVQYQYDSQDNLISVLNLVNAGTGAYVTNCFSYTNAAFPHYITGIIDADGNPVAKNFYDSSGKLVEVQDANGNLTQFIHNLTNSSEIVIDRLRYTNTYVYDPFGNVILQTNQLNQVTTMAYDVNNNKTNEVAFLNGVPYATNSYTYNTNLNVMLTSTDPNNHTSTYTYDSNGDLLISTDANQNGSTNVYDGNGNLIQTVDALGRGVTNNYSDGLLISSENAIGTTTLNTYDNYENLIGTGTVDASSKILSTNTYAYDSDGNRTNSTAWRLVNGNWTPAITQYVYDAKNRVIETINPDGGQSQVYYDNNGNQQETMDALGNWTLNSYDSQSHLIQTVNWDGHNLVPIATNSYSYDANGNRTNTIDANGHSTTYIYDALGRVVQTIYPDGSTNLTVYDGVGRTAETVDARGTTTAFGYDPAGRRLAVTNALGTIVANTNFYFSAALSHRPNQPTPPPLVDNRTDSGRPRRNTWSSRQPVS